MTIDRANQVWAADITYIPMARGFLYLVAIIDWASRAVLAWRLSNSLDVSFRLDALDEALARFGKPEIFNTDQGSQFTSAAFTGRLQAAGVRISMDGVVAGSTTSSSKPAVALAQVRGGAPQAYADGREARAGIAAGVTFYNMQRPHQALGNRVPMAVWRAGFTDPLPGNAVDMTLRLDDAGASPTCPQRQQQPILVA